MAINPTCLDVYFENDLVGHVFDTSPLSFEYAAWWRDHKALQIATITLAAGRTSADGVTSFFENLLPEGELRSYLFTQRKASTLFGLLYAVAGDTAGGFVMLPSGQKPEPHQYQPTSWEELAAELRTKAALAITLKSKGTRISLAGAQDKLSIALFEDGIPRLGEGVSPSTHIVKPDIQRIDGVWGSAINETIVMKAASLCGLQVADVFFEPKTKSCVVKRFDRYVRPDGTIGRSMQYDICQLSSLPSEKKYESEGGPSLKDCADLIRTYSTVPILDLRRLLAWVFFNIFTGNNDSHAKNLSIYCPPEGGTRLTPFYDLMCTRIYPGLSKHFAFDIGGTTLPGEMETKHIVAMAERLDVRPGFAQSIGQEVAKKLAKAVSDAVSNIRPALKPGGETVMANKVSRFVEKTTKQASKRLFGD